MPSAKSHGRVMAMRQAWREGALLRAARAAAGRPRRDRRRRRGSCQRLLDPGAPAAWRRPSWGRRPAPRARPASSTRPRSRMQMRSARATVESLWAMMMAVRLPPPARPPSSLSSARSISRSETGSSRDDASSSTRGPGPSGTRGRKRAVAPRRPRGRRRRPARCRAHWAGGRASRRGRGRSAPRRCARRRPRHRRDVALSRTEASKSCTSWVTRPMRPRSSGKVASRMSSPSSAMRPAVGS